MLISLELSRGDVHHIGVRSGSGPDVQVIVPQSKIVEQSKRKKMLLALWSQNVQNQVGTSWLGSVATQFDMTEEGSVEGAVEESSLLDSLFDPTPNRSARCFQWSRCHKVAGRHG